jgi:hypothetical protein
MGFMQDKNVSEMDCCAPEIYQIRIQGHLKDRWSDWFECMTLTRHKDGTSTLEGRITDQNALHSVLTKIRKMNLKLISVRELEQEEENKSEKEI